MFNHCIYMYERGTDSNYTVTNNMFSRGSSHGVHGRSGGVFTNNHFFKCCVSLQMGYDGTNNALPAGRKAYAYDNVISEGENMWRQPYFCDSQYTICGTALWALVIPSNTSAADVRQYRNIATMRNHSQPVYNGWGFMVSGIGGPAWVQKGQNINYKWTNTTEGTGAGYPNPERTLGTYHQSLGNSNNSQNFVDTMKYRGVRQWSNQYTVKAANNYIRAGFGLPQL